MYRCVFVCVSPVQAKSPDVVKPFSREWVFSEVRALSVPTLPGFDGSERSG